MGGDRWLEFVQGKAEELGGVFVLDCGEGGEMPDPPEGFDDIENLGGWLMTPEQARDIPHAAREERDALFELDSVKGVTAKWIRYMDGGVDVIFIG